MRKKVKDLLSAYVKEHVDNMLVIDNDDMGSGEKEFAEDRSLIKFIRQMDSIIKKEKEDEYDKGFEVGVRLKSMSGT